MLEQNTTYFFVDEAGDAVFYDKRGSFIVGKEGCSKILLLGFVRTENPQDLRKAVLKLRDEIKNDKYLEKIPSIQKTIQSFHAKDDCPEVREKFFKLIVGLDFKAEFFVARKIESLFLSRHQGKASLFYDDLVIKLFENKLHKSESNIIYFANRGNRERQEPLEGAVRTAALTFENKWGKKVDSDIQIFPQTPVGEPCLQIADYMNWATQRAFIKGEERYFKFVEEKISYLVDIYDFDKYPNNFYNKKNRFEVNKISPL
ncbi:MAG: DUF3800 domain-containing protein [Patescibacteria group bacterium]